MKRMLCLLVVCMMIAVVFAGCGKEEAVPDLEDGTPEAAAGGNITVNMGKSGNSLSVPEKFPAHLLPLVDDANVVNVRDNEGDDMILLNMGLTYSTDMEFEDIIEFYEDVMQDASHYSSSTLSDNCSAITGRKEGYRLGAYVTITDGNVGVILEASMLASDSEDDDPATAGDDSTTTDDDSHKELGTLPYDGSDPKDDTGDVGTTTSYFDLCEEVEVSKGYPADKFPLPENDKLCSVSMDDNSTETLYWMKIVSKRGIDDIVDYYASAWGELSDMGKWTSTDEFWLQGSLEDEKYNIYVSGQAAFDDGKTVEYEIIVTVNK